MKKNISDIQNLIQENSFLFWWVPEDKKKNISLDSLVEAILNYGDEKSVKKLFDILGIKTVADIFRKNTTNKSRINYFPRVINYFHLYFTKYVKEYSKQ
ncbi:MAG: hypothetical protein HQK78_12645 [Desulfobacterales bacterium]|nr:hypothetical protein [Desulfobacterales bacterium]